MMQYILWGISFVTLWLVLIWLNFLYSEPVKKRRFNSLVSVGIPVFSRNNDKDPVKTIRSVFASGYPKKLLDVIVVDDGSVDNTLSILRAFKRSHPEFPFKLVSKKNGGKASALNEALKFARGDFFAVVDADSRISKGCISNSLSYFAESVGAVISRVRVDGAVSLLERLQKFEYVMSSMIRSIMSNFGTLSITPGVLSIYDANVLRKVGGFTRDRDNLTEDLEIAMRLKYNGYSVVMAGDSVTYTSVPSTFAQLWRQRVRWARGYFYNHVKFRSMFFSKNHGVFGGFQLPVNVLAVVLLIANVSIIFFDVFESAFDFVFRSFTIPNYFINQITSFPSLTEFVLARNVQIYLPILIAFVLGVYLIIFAHRLFKEDIKSHLYPLVTYTVVMPYFSAVNWISSIAQEVLKTKRKW